MTKQTKFILAIALQVVIIFAIVISKLSVLTSGTEVLLRIRRPILLRGDYAIFQYDISYLINSYYSRRQQIRNGDVVYVVLRQTGKYWTAQNVQKTKPAGNELFIKGKVESGGLENQIDPFSYQRFSNSVLHIVYGIEQYFIPEGKVQNFNFRTKEAAAMIAIDNNGNAVIKKIYVDDKPWP